MKLLFFDTESTDLAASWGRLLAASFVSLEGYPYTFRSDKRPHKGENGIDDSKLAISIRNELEGADIIIGWNSILHDIPLLNARLSRVNERPCKLGEKNGVWHLDAMYYVAGQSMKIGGKKLDTAAKYFQVNHQKTSLDGQIWQLASVGDKKAMDSVVEHCEADVMVLRDLWPSIAPYIKKFQFDLSEVWPWISEIQSRRA